MKLEYVLSGLSHTKITTTYFNDLVLKKLAYDALLSVIKTTNHDLGLLFNAMTESSFPDSLEYYRPVVKSIHSDSGGLQLAQQGKQLTSEIEKKIYKTQCLNSNVAMSIDKIPLEILSGMGDPRTDMNSKKFVISENYAAGVESGKNINRQIQAFKTYRGLDTTGYNCKPLIVIQGNSLDDYVTYFDAIMSQIDKADIGMIGGYALAGSAIGIGTLEAVDTIFSFLTLDRPKEIQNKIHFLGYGSVQRLMPILAIKNTLLKDYEISYDSTSHTSKYNFGSILDENGQDMAFGMVQNDLSRRVMGLVYDRFEDAIRQNLCVTKETWVEVVTSQLTGSTRYHGNSEESIIHRSGVLLCALTSCYNFMKLVDKTEDDITHTNKPYTRVLKYISDKCNTSSDWFDVHRSKVSHFLQSKRIERVTTRGNNTTLLEF